MADAHWVTYFRKQASTYDLTLASLRTLRICLSAMILGMEAICMAGDCERILYDYDPVDRTYRRYSYIGDKWDRDKDNPYTIYEINPVGEIRGKLGDHAEVLLIGYNH